MNDGNREIGKSNRVPCHRPSLPPSVSQQMLCSTKTLSAAKEWAEICWQWRWGLEGNEKRDKKEEINKTKNQHCHTPSSQWRHSTREEGSAWVYAQTSLQELDLLLWKHTRTPPCDYFYSIRIHAHTCQLQARRRLSPDGGELHNSLICLWPLKECLKASPIPSGRHQKTQRGRGTPSGPRHCGQTPFLSVPQIHPPFFFNLQPPKTLLVIPEPFLESQRGWERGHWFSHHSMGQDFCFLLSCQPTVWLFNRLKLGKNVWNEVLHVLSTYFIKNIYFTNIYGVDPFGLCPSK